MGKTATVFYAPATDGASDNNGSDSGQVTIRDSYFANNQGTGQGGAVFSFVYPPDTVLIERAAFFNNTISKDAKGDALGGALRHGNGQLVIRDSVFVENVARAQGGGLWIGERSGNSRLINTTFYRNQAVEDPDTGNGGLGGAVAPLGGSLLISHSTFVENHAGFVGGAFFVSSEDNTTLRNSIIAHNTAFNSGNDWDQLHNCSSEMQDGGNNIQFPGKNPNNSFDSDCTNRVQIIEPLLGEFLARTDATATVTLQANSPAIDASNSDCPLLDQRGMMRPQGGGCDIGAFEYTPNYDQGLSVNTGTSSDLSRPSFCVAFKSCYG